MRRDEATLLDIAKAARLVMTFTQGMAKEEFLNDLKTQSAVLYQLLVLGEAVKRLSREFRAQYPDIPWSLIAGMRDHLIHGYDIYEGCAGFIGQNRTIASQQTYRAIIIDGLITWYLESKQEERFMLEKFGKEYEEYMRKAAMFFPKTREVKENKGGENDSYRFGCQSGRDQLLHNRL